MMCGEIGLRVEVVAQGDDGLSGTLLTSNYHIHIIYTTLINTNPDLKRKKTEPQRVRFDYEYAISGFL